MSNDPQNVITDESFADLIIDLTRMSKEERDSLTFPMQKINEQLAVIHIPVADITPEVIQKYGYSAMPKCYGITTYRNEVIDYAYTVQRFGLEDIRGSGILVGIVDTGIDYTNPVFIRANNTSKIRAIWDQTIENTEKTPVGFLYGTEYTDADINEALSRQNPLEVVPSVDEVGEGTAMAAIAAGNASAVSGFSGISINAELAIVKLKPAKGYLREFYGIPATAFCYQENDIMMGVKYLLQVAERLNMPIAVCIGLSSSQGAHDGRDITSKYLEECGKNTGVGIAVAVGNEGNQDLHYYGLKLANENAITAELNVSKDDPNFTAELWTNIQSSFVITILSPTGETVLRLDTSLPPSRNETVTYEGMTLYADLILNETYADKKLVMLRFKNIQEGIWKFQLQEGEGVIALCHIWLPIRNFLSENTYFLNPNMNTTISTPGNGEQIITVTSYNAVNNTLAPSAGRGFTSNNLPKPDIAAPGENIIVPTLDGGFYPLSGSGLAVAFTGGILAAMLEGGAILNLMPDINTQLLRYILTYLARRNPNEEYPNPDWGYGYII